MSLPVTSSFALASYADVSAASKAPAAPPAQTTAEPAPYVVKLTEAEQAFQLSLQGQTVPQIAEQLNLTVDAVNKFLGISDSPNPAQRNS